MDNVYILRVSLQGFEDVWRDIAVRGSQTLGDLHEAIFRAFDRFDPHLYSFFRGRSRTKYDVEYTVAEGLEDMSLIHGERFPVFDASNTIVGSLYLKKGEKFWYLFDYGDCWEHEIKVKEVLPVESGVKCPCVVGSQGKSPPQYPEVGDE